MLLLLLPLLLKMMISRCYSLLLRCSSTLLLAIRNGLFCRSISVANRIECLFPPSETCISRRRNCIRARPSCSPAEDTMDSESSRVSNGKKRVIALFSYHHLSSVIKYCHAGDPPPASAASVEKLRLRQHGSLCSVEENMDEIQMI